MRAKGFEGKKRIFSFAFVVVLFFSLTYAPIVEAEEVDCERALAKCGFSALMAGIGNPLLGTALGIVCTMGYAWCLEYFTS